MCPNCRAMTDLEADVEDVAEWNEDLEIEEGGAEAGLDGHDGEARPAQPDQLASAGRDFSVVRPIDGRNNGLEGEIVGRATREAASEGFEREAISQPAVPTSHASGPGAGVSELPTLATRGQQSRPAELAAPEPDASELDVGPNSARTPKNAIGSAVKGSYIPPQTTSPAVPGMDFLSAQQQQQQQQQGRMISERALSQGSASGLRPGTPGQAQGMEVEGPLTPRNDAGPFVFDGSGGRGIPGIGMGV